MISGQISIEILIAISPGVYCEWSDFINIWVRGGDFGTDYNMDFN